MNTGDFIIGAGGMFLTCVLAAAAVQAAVTVDGDLSEAEWKNAVWHRDFRRFRKPPMNDRTTPTSAAWFSDGKTLYVAAKCEEPAIDKIRAKADTSLWMSDNLELFLCPDGTTFNIYHFAIGTNSKDAVAEFYSEGGNIQPDPYAPEWSHAVKLGETGWTAEFAIPLSAFYMTRNSAWSEKWRLNVCRTFTVRGFDYASLSPLYEHFLEPKNFREENGFPRRLAEDDTAVKSVLAEITAKGEKLTGELELELFVGEDGEYEIETEGDAGRAPAKRFALKAGPASVKVPCVYAVENRVLTHVAVKNVKTGNVCSRYYPVLVEYRPVRVKFTTPQYRDSFYPGQDVSKIEGEVAVQGGKDAELVLEGEGFPRRTLFVKGGRGRFSFDTRGFKPGTDARLTVVEVESPSRTKELNHLSSTSTSNFNSSTSTPSSSTSNFDSFNSFTVRNLKGNGGQMVWIENGHLVVNGKPVFRRNTYGHNYMTGRAFDEMYNAPDELKTFCLTPDFRGTLNAEMGRVVTDRNLEREEGVRDVMPCKEYLDRLRAMYEKNKDRPFGAWYICDEPECRSISTVYLKNLYEFMKKLDPYHPCFMASRGGKAFIDCADWFETHPYLNCQYNEKGERVYSTSPYECGSFVEAFEPEKHPDKCVGFLSTMFAYRWTSYSNDYPTFDEYVEHNWVAICRGSKTVWPYCSHDYGDRPALYHGNRWVFRSIAALEDFLLLGRRTLVTKSPEAESATWELNGETLKVEIDHRTHRTEFTMPERCRASIGESLEAARARVAKLEAERLGRDNQLRGRYADLEVTDNFKVKNFGGGHYKLVDGSRYFFARGTGGNVENFLEIAMMNGLKPRFDKVRVYGWLDPSIKGIELTVGDGASRRKLPAKVTHPAKYDWVLELAEPVTAERIRLDFPGTPAQKNDIELYEIELPMTCVRMR